MTEPAAESEPLLQEAFRFFTAVIVSIVVPATALDVLWIRGPIIQMFDPAYPWVLHIVLRPVVGGLLAVIIWPTFRTFDACVLAAFTGILLLGGDLAFSERTWRSIGPLAQFLPPALKYCVATIGLIHLMACVLLVQWIRARHETAELIPPSDDNDAPDGAPYSVTPRAAIRGGLLVAATRLPALASQASRELPV